MIPQGPIRHRSYSMLMVLEGRGGGTGGSLEGAHGHQKAGASLEGLVQAKVGGGHRRRGESDAREGAHLRHHLAEHLRDLGEVARGELLDPVVDRGVGRHRLLLRVVRAEVVHLRGLLRVDEAHAAALARLAQQASLHARLHLHLRAVPAREVLRAAVDGRRAHRLRTEVVPARLALPIPELDDEVVARAQREVVGRAEVVDVVRLALHHAVVLDADLVVPAAHQVGE
mmetsp:Transcript_10091/g.25144  ORF Transcript_10091/g.25144 Transcript_10091/m.25144 type:complete len:228 (+) Transcript_10091:338-1021(+)